MHSSPTSSRTWVTDYVAVLVAIAATTLAGTAPVRAHGGPPITRRVAFHPTEPDTIYAQATFGLLISRDRGLTWSLACEEAIGWQTTENPHILGTTDGAVVFGLFKGLYRSSTFCGARLPQPELENVPIISMDRDPAEPRRLYAVTSLGSFENAVYVSDDDGLSWAPTGDRFAVGDLPEEVRVAPSAPETLYVSGVRLEPRIGFVARSDDSGGTWTTYDVALRGAVSVFLGAVDPADPRRLLAYRPYTDEADALMLSEDGGETWDEVASVSGDLKAVAFAPDGSRVWYGGDEKGLYLSLDGGRTFEPQYLELTVRCLVPREGELWVCADNFADGFAVGVSLDGGDNFEPRLRYRQLAGQVECGEGTRSAEVCPIAWRAILELFGLDAGPPSGDGGVRTDAGAGRPDGGSPTMDADRDRDLGADGGGTGDDGCGCTVGRDGAERHVSFAVCVALAAGVLVRRHKRRLASGVRSDGRGGGTR